MSEQAEVEQQEAVQEQGNLSSEQEASAGGQPSSAIEGNVPTEGVEGSAVDAQPSGPIPERAAGDQEIARLKDLNGNSMDSSMDSSMNSPAASSLENGSASNQLNTGLGGQSNGAGALNMDSLMDVPVTLSVEIGRKRMPINQLVNLAPGAIVDLNRDLDAPIDLLVNGTLIARGEVVVMGKKFGLRLVDICSPNERLRGLSQ